MNKLGRRLAQPSPFCSLTAEIVLETHVVCECLSCIVDLQEFRNPAFLCVDGASELIQHPTQCLQNMFVIRSFTPISVLTYIGSANFTVASFLLLSSFKRGANDCSCTTHALGCFRCIARRGHARKACPKTSRPDPQLIRNTHLQLLLLSALSSLWHCTPTAAL